jgi:hypothetical protein
MYPIEYCIVGQDSGGNDECGHNKKQQRILRVRHKSEDGPWYRSYDTDSEPDTPSSPPSSARFAHYVKIKVLNS